MVILAEQVGSAVAKAGAILVCGGLAGVMLGAARGAKKAGGMTVGLLPGTDRSEANAYVDVAVATGLGFARNALVAQAGDAVVAVDGEFGTLSEIGFALQFKKPVVGLKSWILKKDGLENSLHGAETAEEAVRTACRLARERLQSGPA